MAGDAAGDDRFLGTKIMCRTKERWNEEQARPERLTRRVGRVCDERPSDGERHVIFVFFREGHEEAEGEECRKRNLTEESEAVLLTEIQKHHE